MYIPTLSGHIHSTNVCKLLPWEKVHYHDFILLSLNFEKVNLRLSSHTKGVTVFDTQHRSVIVMNIFIKSGVKMVILVRKNCL